MINPSVLNVFVVLLVVAVSFMKNNKKVQNFLISKIETLLYKNLKTTRDLENSFSKVPVSFDSGLGNINPFFTNGAAYTLKDLYDGLCAFKMYEMKSLQYNNVIRKRYNSLPKAQFELVKTIKYGEKLDAVDNTVVEVNQVFMNSLITSYLENNKTVKQKLEEHDPELQLRTPINSNGIAFHRIVETLNHLVRDYSEDMFNMETKPLLEYIQSRLNTIKSLKSEANLNNGKTCIILPGSGVGRIAHEVATEHPNANVHSIEFSSLMYLANQFVYGGKETSSVSPFCNYYSNHLNTEDQLRKFELPLGAFTKPENLKAHYGDFTKFTLASDENEYQNIVIVTAFFIDTAENLLSYLDAIESFQRNLADNKKSTLHWINIGPLKYGTKPMIQLTKKELTLLRKERGWLDLQELCDTSKNIGYITDEKSLYKSYYSVLQFHATKK
ncbi:Uncharacterized protein AWRI3579_g3467 [Hanseniaspora osmophila]|uniref:Uncharacterized protein n=1 Tax=Hanseniaspora osmophila TaxID=56408 RepID=A0A1E5R915_9ASCO|nr:Uncharacterized protein AWRI3579_g3467 [Hanseniaspora osmophila]